MVIGSTAPTIETLNTTTSKPGVSNYSTMNVPSCSNGVDQQLNYATPQWIPSNHGAQVSQVAHTNGPLTAASYIDLNQLVTNPVFFSSEPQLSLSDTTVDGQSTSTLETQTYYLQVPPAEQNGQHGFQLSATSAMHNQGQTYTQQQQPQLLQQYNLHNGDWKSDVAYPGFVQNSTMSNDDQNSMQSSFSHSSTPSPKPQLTIPPNQNYPGEMPLFEVSVALFSNSSYYINKKYKKQTKLFRSVQFPCLLGFCSTQQREENPSLDVFSDS